jgi:hypothetical protein
MYAFLFRYIFWPMYYLRNKMLPVCFSFFSLFVFVHMNDKDSGQSFHLLKENRCRSKRKKKTIFINISDHLSWNFRWKRKKRKIKVSKNSIIDTGMIYLSHIFTIHAWHVGQNISQEKDCLFWSCYWVVVKTMEVRRLNKAKK